MEAFSFRPRLAPSGVPQGAVLSPIFNIYTCDLAEAVLAHGVKYCAFADDWKATGNFCSKLSIRLAGRGYGDYLYLKQKLRFYT
ncbi:hypothetical protein ANCDUO_13105 [Ancylostoma duodenale]|uniref:Reverse transcriptase domain-containing protein n=1 Tax=Ancylostoma duodenale TaxID=51022 RepID=A0A0C2CJS6_9BILA|nr:hypothetical protein ANCDUO_13105 [Ancylostoma duodenale]